MTKKHNIIETTTETTFFGRTITRKKIKDQFFGQQNSRVKYCLVLKAGSLSWACLVQ